MQAAEFDELAVLPISKDRTTTHGPLLAGNRRNGRSCLPVYLSVKRLGDSGTNAISPTLTITSRTLDS